MCIRDRYSPCEKYLKANPKKPLIQCEYGHSMGNSMGGFEHYWNMIRKYPQFQGGFIWDFVDQGIRQYDDKGNMYYAYGGDFNPYDCLLYTSDAADEEDSVDLGGRRTIKKKQKKEKKKK